MEKNTRSRMIKWVGMCSLALPLVLAGCQTGGYDFMGSQQSSGLQVSSSKERLSLDLTSLFENWEREVTTPQGQLAVKAIQNIEAGNLVEGTENINLALKLDFGNTGLQLLNAMNYHMRALGGEGELYDMAEQGYLAAIRFDKSNWAARYYLGVLYADQRRYRQAMVQFGAYVLQRDDDAEGLYYLAATAYLAGEPVTAAAAARGLEQLVAEGGANDMDPAQVLKLLTITKAAARHDAEAEAHLKAIENLQTSADSYDYLKRRVSDWQYFYESSEAELTEVQSSKFSFGKKSKKKKKSSSSSSNRNKPNTSAVGGSLDNDFIQNSMVAVDVVILRTEEDSSSSIGINLLKGLELQFGNIDENLPFVSFADELEKNDADPDDNELKSTIVRALSLPAVSYTLNIANAVQGRNEILARPTLVARNGQTSEFFSGVEVAAAAVSGGAGDSISIEKEIGVKLSVTPEVAPGETVFLQVEAERTFLTQPSSSVVFEYRLDTSKTTVNANVAMKFGQTLILSGLSERETENDSDKVPFVGDIPVVNLLFNQRSSRDYNKSVLVLLTPRKAQYTYDSRASRKAATIQEESLDQDRKADLLKEDLFGEIERRHQDWFRPMPTVSEIMKHMRTNRLYRYFHTGDIEFDPWTLSDSNAKRVKRVLLRSIK